MGNGNVTKLKRDLDLLDIEELKINREMYMLQLKINETSENKKKVRVKKNYLQITERKLKALENKENQNMQLEIINNNAENNNNNKNEFQRETNPGKNSGEVIKSEISPKKTSIIIGKSMEKINSNKNENNNLKSNEIIKEYSETISKLSPIKYNKEEHKKETENKENIINKSISIKEEINEDDINENININVIRKSKNNIDKISKISVQPNYNKSMDNKNESLVDEVEIVGLSEDGVLKDRISDILIRNSSISNSSAKNNASESSISKKGSVSSIPKQDKNLISYSESEKKSENNISDKDEENEKKNEEKIQMNARRLLKNNRNKSYFVLNESEFTESSKQSISNNDK